MKITSEHGIEFELFNSMLRKQPLTIRIWLDYEHQTDEEVLHIRDVAREAAQKVWDAANSTKGDVADAIVALPDICAVQVMDKNKISAIRYKGWPG